MDDLVISARKSKGSVAVDPVRRIFGLDQRANADLAHFGAMKSAYVPLDHAPGFVLKLLILKKFQQRDVRPTAIHILLKLRPDLAFTRVKLPSGLPPVFPAAMPRRPAGRAGFQDRLPPDLKGRRRG